MRSAGLRASIAAIIGIGSYAAGEGQTPRIDSIDPPQGPIAGGTAITIKGANFSGATVRVDSTAVTTSASSDTEIRFTTAAHDNGIARINVTNPVGTTVGEFLFTPPKLKDLPSGYITTIAGIGQYTGLFRKATAATIQPQGNPAYDTKGNLYIAEPNPNRVVRVRPDGVVEPFAGTGASNYGSAVGHGSLATLAVLNFPRSVTTDVDDNVYIPDQGHWVHRVDGRTGIITAYAGTGVGGFSGDGGPALQARLNNVSHITGDGHGTVYFIDGDDVTGGARIRKVTPAGIISTVAGTGSPGFSGDGGPATAAQFNFLYNDLGSLALDPQGNLFVMDVGNRRLRRIDGKTGIITTVFTSDQTDYPFSAVATDSSGNIYFESQLKLIKLDPTGQIVASYGSGKYPGISNDGAAMADAFLSSVMGIVIDPAGNIVFGQADLQRVQRLNLTTGKVETVAGLFPRLIGENGAAIAGPLENMFGDIAVLPSGDLLVTDSWNQVVRRIDQDGNFSTTSQGGARALSAGGSKPIEVFVNPYSIRPDGAGNLYLADGFNIFRIDAAGTVQRIAGQYHKTGFGGDGGPALDAILCQPWDVARDVAGNLYIADTNNNRVRRVDALTGIITTVAGSGPSNGVEHYQQGGPSSGDGGPATQARLNTPYGVAVDANGNLYVSDSSGRIRKVDLNGIITTFATVDGGIHTKLVFDRAGNLYGIRGSVLIRYDKSGNSTVLAGDRTKAGFAGDGGPSALALMQANLQAEGIAIDAEGNIFFNDGDNRRVRAIRRGATFAPLTVDTTTTLTVLAGQSPTLSLATASSATVSYSWKRNGTNIVGATTASYTINSAQPGDTGTYTVTVAPSTGTTASASVILTVNEVPVPSRLTNLSILSDIAAPGGSFTMGAIIGPAGTIGTLPLLVRAAGPGLVPYGVVGVLPDPNLEFFTAQTKTGTNDNWGGTTVLTGAFAQVGAFPFPSADSKDAAIFNPAVAAGSNSVRITGVDGTTGRVIAELYDASAGNTRTATSPRLINGSVLKEIGGGFTVGFVIGGSLSRTVLIRAVGPGLATVGVSSETVNDPTIALFNGTTEIASNDNWAGSSVLTASFAQVGAFPLPASSKDAALLADLGPGSYSVQVAGYAQTTGLVLVEIYEVP